MNLRGLKSRLARLEQFSGKRKDHLDPSAITDLEWAVLAVLRHSERFAGRPLDAITDQELAAATAEARLMLQAPEGRKDTP